MLEREWLDCPWWITYGGAKRLGGYVNPIGEDDPKGIPIVKWVPKKYTTKEVDEETGEETRKERMRLVPKIYVVYNAKYQCSNLTLPASPTELNNHDTLADAEAFITAYTQGPPIIPGGDKAAYQPKRDRILLPERGQFDSILAFYATWAHEQAHACAHPTRLDWPELFNATYGSDDYAMGELIAEMTAAMFCGALGFEENLDQSVAYTQHFWRKYLSADPGRLVFAAQRAQKALNFLAGTGGYVDEGEIT